MEGRTLPPARPRQGDWLFYARSPAAGMNSTCAGAPTPIPLLVAERCRGPRCRKARDPIERLLMSEKKDRGNLAPYEKLVQHGYAMVAGPLVFLPLGAVILDSSVLPRVLGYTALALGAVFAVLGLVGVLAPVQGIVDGLSALQGLWWTAAAVALLRQPAGWQLR